MNFRENCFVQGLIAIGFRRKHETWEDLENLEG